MEDIKAGSDPSCEEASGWLVGFGSVISLSGALLPLGIVVTGAGVASAFFCASR